VYISFIFGRLFLIFSFSSLSFPLTDGAKNAARRTTRNTGAPSGATWTRLDGRAGSYASATEFYRDLLLLCANALVFFPRGSPEHSAAARTRALVAKHMSKDQLAGPSGKAAAGTAASKKAKAEADVGSLLEKTALIIVCRKRSSIAKAAAAAVTAKEEKAETDDKEEKEQKEAVGKRKAAAKDRAARGPRTNKTRGGPAVRKAAAAQHQKAAAADNGSDSNAPPEEAKKQTAADKKGSAGVAKKRNAVNFLNRMKQGGSAPSETLKLSAQAEQKKAGKDEGKKEPAGGSGSKKAPQGRRNVGRSPKRAAAPPSPPPSKRAKGGGGGKRGGRKK
jgi:hypothetical protein